jgi:hypothetical protein
MGLFMDPKVIETLAGWKDPLGYPWSTYAWVVFIACVAGTVKHLNNTKTFKLGKLLLSWITSGFMGVIAFWLCESRDIHGPMSAVVIALAGAMGFRFWTEVENIARIKFGLKKSEDEANP